MNIAQSRLYFKVQHFLTPTVKLNFKSEKRFWSEKFICNDCMEENPNLSQSTLTDEEQISVEISSRKYRGYPDDQRHLMVFCRANQDLREGKNVMENQMDCVTFFYQLIQRRMNKLS